MTTTALEAAEKHLADLATNRISKRELPSAFHWGLIQSMATELRSYRAVLEDVRSTLDDQLGDTDPVIDAEATDEDVRDEEPIFWCHLRIAKALRLETARIEGMREASSQHHQRFAEYEKAINDLSLRLDEGDRREQALKVAIRDLTQTNKSIEGQLEECEKERESYRLQVVARRTEIAGLRSRLGKARKVCEEIVRTYEDSNLRTNERLNAMYVPARDFLEDERGHSSTVEHDASNVGATGSSPVDRSTRCIGSPDGRCQILRGQEALGDPRVGVTLKPVGLP